MKIHSEKSTKNGFRETYVTKQILNEKNRRLMKPHQRQIMNEIKASLNNEIFQMQKNLTMQNIRKSYHHSSSYTYNDKQQKRPKTAIKFKIQEKQNQRDDNFVQKVKYQIGQIQKISEIFKLSVDQDKKHVHNKKSQSRKLKKNKNKNNFSHVLLKCQTQLFDRESKVQQDLKLKKILKNRIKFRTNKTENCEKDNIKKIIPVKKAQNQDVKLLTRCITGCYFDDIDDYCDSISRAQLIKVKKSFLTFDTLYNSIKGDRKGIKDLKPGQIKNRSLLNLVYYLQNEKGLKLADKVAIQQKMNFFQ